MTVRVLSHSRHDERVPLYSDIPELFSVPAGSDYTYIGERQNVTLGESGFARRVGSGGFSACAALLLLRPELVTVAHVTPLFEGWSDIDLNPVFESAVIVKGETRSFTAGRVIESLGSAGFAGEIELVNVPNEQRSFDIYFDESVRQLATVSRGGHASPPMQTWYQIEN